MIVAVSAIIIIKRCLYHALQRNHHHLNMNRLKICHSMYFNLEYVFFYLSKNILHMFCAFGRFIVACSMSRGYSLLFAMPDCRSGSFAPPSPPSVLFAFVCHRTLIKRLLISFAAFCCTHFNSLCVIGCAHVHRTDNTHFGLNFIRTVLFWDVIVVCRRLFIEQKNGIMLYAKLYPFRLTQKGLLFSFSFTVAILIRRRMTMWSSVRARIVREKECVKFCSFRICMHSVHLTSIFRVIHMLYNKPERVRGC